MRFNSIFYGSMCLLVMVWVSSLNADWEPYHARYAIYRNGKLIGKAEVSFELNGDHWSMSSEGSGTHGLARLLRAQDNEYSEGGFKDGRFRPQKYSHHTRIAGIDDVWTADFDWQTNTVEITKGKDILSFDMGPEALDALSIKLEMQRRLRENDPNMMFWLVDDDEVKEQAFRILESEQLETSLGCLQTTPVERVRQGGKRYTKAWHAPALGYLLVRLEHGKTNGDQIEMRISDLSLNDREIKPQPGCIARQKSP